LSWSAEVAEGEGSSTECGGIVEEVIADGEKQLD
jgi:hypothetical protein